MSEHRIVTGDGIYQDVKDLVRHRYELFKSGPRTTQSARLRKELSVVGSTRITDIQIARKPILTIVDKALNALSLGAFAKRQKSLGYDNLYHNYMLVTLEDGRKLKIEKNHIVELTDATTNDYSSERYNIPVKMDINLDQMLNGAARDNDRFYLYSANERQNCQSFTRDMIVKNNLTPDNPVIVQNQQVDTILDTLPLGHLIPDAVTNVAGRVDRVYHGDGKFHRFELFQ